MPRLSDGTYVLPAGNPVAGGTTITSNWANVTLDDIATAMTQSLDTEGRNDMNAPVNFEDGTMAAPGITYGQEPSSGFYRAGTGDIRVSVLGTDLFRWNNGVAQIWDAGATIWRTVSTITAGAGSGTIDPGTAENQAARFNNTSGIWEAVNFFIDTSANATTAGFVDAADLKISGSSIATIYAPRTTTLFAGNGLVGTGQLTANVTFDVVGGTGITVNADNILLDLTYTDNRYVQSSGGGTAPVAELLNVSTGTNPQPGSYYLAYTNMTGTVPTNDLSGTYSNTSITGNAGTATTAVTASTADAVNDSEDVGSVWNIAVVSGGSPGADPNTLYFVTA